MKHFKTPSVAKEIKVYSLLQKNDVPTLSVYGITDNTILLEDLNLNTHWRCANEADMNLFSTGNAVVDWYQKLHTMGFEVIGKSEEKLEYLQFWIDAIDQKVLEKAGKTLEVTNYGSWKLGMENCEAIKIKYHSFPQTFDYSDFAAENLALSRGYQTRLRAIVYDYDQFNIGTVYSDWRNVTFSLKGKARDVFITAYGEVSEDERRLDEVLNVLYGLIVATARTKFPTWALRLRKSIENGELEKSIRSALEII
jgi:hypothetical protein